MAVSALQRHLHEAVQECVKTRDHLIIKRTVDKQKIQLLQTLGYFRNRFIYLTVNFIFDVFFYTAKVLNKKPMFTKHMVGKNNKNII